MRNLLIRVNPNLFEGIVDRYDLTLDRVTLIERHIAELLVFLREDQVG